MTPQALEYRFEPVNRCDMCGAHPSRAVLLGRRLNARQGLRPRRRSGITVSIMRCGVCGLVFSNPLPVPLELSQHYEREPEEYWSDPSYFQEDRSYFAEQIEHFRRLWSGGRAQPVALDVGAGLGKAMRALDSHGFVAYGLEPSAQFRSVALDRGGVSEEKLALGSVESQDYEGEMFDFVTFGAVLEHLQHPGAALTRALRWTAPGGLVHVEVPSAEWLTARLLNAVYRLQGLDYVCNLSPLHPPFHLYEFTLTSFQAHARENGYELAFHRRMVADTYLPRYLSPLASKVMARTGTGMQLEVWLRRPSTADTVGFGEHR